VSGSESGDSVRVYLPATSSTLRRLLGDGELTANAVAPLVGFAVTEGLRDYYADDDEESLEYAALTEAARASLRLIEADPDAWRRRVVVAVDVESAGMAARDDLDRGVVQVRTSVPLSSVASVHVDDQDAEGVVAAAAGAMLAAELGDESAQEAVDDAEGFDLSWYASQEIGPLLDLT
jgi:hypothetical protein